MTSTANNISDKIFVHFCSIYDLCKSTWPMAQSHQIKQNVAIQHSATIEKKKMNAKNHCNFNDTIMDPGLGIQIPFSDQVFPHMHFNVLVQTADRPTSLLPFLFLYFCTHYCAEETESNYFLTCNSQEKGHSTFGRIEESHKNPWTSFMACRKVWHFMSYIACTPSTSTPTYEYEYNRYHSTTGTGRGWLILLIVSLFIS